jgi:hypothetical protein
MSLVTHDAPVSSKRMWAGRIISGSGTSRCDTEQYANGAGHPLPLWCGFPTEASPAAAAQRQQEPRVEDQHRRASFCVIVSSKQRGLLRDP